MISLNISYYDTQGNGTHQNDDTYASPTNDDFLRVQSAYRDLLKTFPEEDKEKILEAEALAQHRRCRKFVSVVSDVRFVRQGAISFSRSKRQKIAKRAKRLRQQMCGGSKETCTGRKVLRNLLQSVNKPSEEEEHTCTEEEEHTCTEEEEERTESLKNISRHERLVAEQKALSDFERGTSNFCFLFHDNLFEGLTCEASPTVRTLVRTALQQAAQEMQEELELGELKKNFERGPKTFFAALSELERLVPEWDLNEIVEEYGEISEL
jgi:hypothetical protein